MSAGTGSERSCIPMNMMVSEKTGLGPAWLGNFQSARSWGNDFATPVPEALTLPSRMRVHTVMQNRLWLELRLNSSIPPINYCSVTRFRRKELVDSSQRMEERHRENLSRVKWRLRSQTHCETNFNIRVIRSPTRKHSFQQSDANLYFLILQRPKKISSQQHLQCVLQACQHWE